MRNRGWALVVSALILWALAAVLIVDGRHNEQPFGVRRASTFPPASTLPRVIPGDCLAERLSGWHVNVGISESRHVVTVSRGDQIDISGTPSFSDALHLCFDTSVSGLGVDDMVAEHVGSVFIAFGSGSTPAMVRIDIIAAPHGSATLGLAFVLIGVVVLTLGLTGIGRRRPAGPTDRRRADDAEREPPFDPERAIDAAETAFIRGANKPFG